MKQKLILALALSVSLMAQAAETESGFTVIFNGKDLTGWDGNRTLWSAKDGAIVGQTTAEHPASGNTFLVWTNGSVADFELRFSYKITADNDKSFGDSGVQYRSKQLPNFVVTGYQANLMVTKPLTGILYEEKGRAIIHQLGQKVVIRTDSDDTNKFKVEVIGSLGKSDEIQAAFKTNDWNQYVVIAQGNRLQHFINGKQTADVTDEDTPRAAKSGVLALQLHAGPPMTVEFKNIRIKTLSPAAQSGGDAERANGDWEIVSMEANGQAMPAETTEGLRLTVKGEKYFVNKDGEIDRGTFSVDATKSPKQMDIHPEIGPGAGKTILGIFEITEDTMRVCYQLQDGDDRPKGFKTSQDSGELLITYKRAKR